MRCTPAAATRRHCPAQSVLRASLTLAARLLRAHTLRPIRRRERYLLSLCNAVPILIWNAACDCAECRTPRGMRALNCHSPYRGDFYESQCPVVVRGRTCSDVGGLLQAGVDVARGLGELASCGYLDAGAFHERSIDGSGHNDPNAALGSDSASGHDSRRRHSASAAAYG